MLKVKSIKPVFNRILVTADKYLKDVKENGILIYTAGTLKEYQKVIAVGNTVRAVGVGDVVKINPTRYEIKRYEEDSLKNDLGMNKVIKYNFNIIDLDDKEAILLYDSDIDYILTDYEEQESNSTSTLIIPDNKIIV